MPGHDHSFRELFPRGPLHDISLLLNWACPVLDTENEIEDIFKRYHIMLMYISAVFYLYSPSF